MKSHYYSNAASNCIYCKNCVKSFWKIEYQESEDIIENHRANYDDKHSATAFRNKKFCIPSPKKNKENNHNSNNNDDCFIANLFLPWSREDIYVPESIALTILNCFRIHKHLPFIGYNSNYSNNQSPLLDWLSYGRCMDEFIAIGSALHQLEFSPGSTIGILSPNRCECEYLIFYFQIVIYLPFSFVSYEFLIAVLASIYQGMSYAPFPELFTELQIKHFVDCLNIRLLFHTIKTMYNY
jgi:hypothetical protein